MNDSRTAKMNLVRIRFLELCARAESMVSLSVRSVIERNGELGRSVIEADNDVNRLEVEIDGMCIDYLSTSQPKGQELRSITTLLKMVTDVERIGDLAVGIARRGLDLSAGAGVEPDTNIPAMTQIAVDMIRNAADAFVHHNADLARSVIARDDEVDRLNDETLKKWLTAMAAHPDQTERALWIITIARHVERVADHACNLAEMVVFWLEGKDLRHGG